MVLPITEKEISETTQSPVFSPILCADLSFFGIPKDEFLPQFSESFQAMAWDYYDVKRKQLELLKEHNIEIPFDSFRNYYQATDQNQQSFLASLITDQSLIDKCLTIKPWRRRSVCSFDVKCDEDISLSRIQPSAFSQEVDAEDIRSLPREFQQTANEVADNIHFHSFIKKVAAYAQQVTPHIDIKQLTITAHFMSVKARQHVPGNNSPEGAHEDGADFIVSALVINRQNITGAKSQVLEKLPDGKMINIFERELQEGEFLFQADTGEEKHYGNDLWHYVTPFYVTDPLKESWRDIIGLDIVITQPKI